MWRRLAVTAIVLLVLGVAAEAQLGSPLFTARFDVAIVEFPFALHVFDLDGDGDLDIVSSSENKAIWLEHTQDAFLAFVSHSVLEGPVGEFDVRGATAVADINSDGNADIVTTWSGGFAIVWNESDGASPPVFTMRSVATLPTPPTYLAAGDLDADGDSDIVSCTSNTIYLHRNLRADQGAVGWVTTQIWTMANVGFREIFIADLDGDGDRDIAACAAFQNRVIWFENTAGPGAPPVFVQGDVFLGATFAYSVFAADVNGDGRMDLVSASNSDDTIRWHENLGGSPVSFATHTVFTGADGARSVACADFDGDGDLDILSCSENDDAVRWHENLGGPAPAFATHAITACADHAGYIAIADMDGDGDPDAVCASEFDDSIRWFRNDRGAFNRVAFAPHTVGAITGPFDATAADLDTDGDLDLIACSTPGTPSVVRWYERAGGDPPAFVEHTIVSSSSSYASVHAADFDGDTHPDILVYASFGTAVRYYLSDGLSPPGYSAVGVYAGPGGGRAYAADLDGDGDMDACSIVSSKIFWHENIGGAPPNLATTRTVFDFAGMNSQLQALACADLDGDGDVDLVSADGGNSLKGLRWHANDGAGPASPPSFTLMPDLLPGVKCFGVGAVDFDADGDVDLMVGTVGDVLFLENNGANPPSFTTHTVASAPGNRNVRWVAAGDLDRDGDLDIVSGTDNDDAVRWHENITNGAGGVWTFVTHTVKATKGRASVWLADIDADGDLDILSADNNSGAVIWHENLKPNTDLNADTHVNSVDLALLLGSWGMCALPPASCRADLNGDGIVSAADLALLLGSWGN